MKTLRKAALIASVVVPLPAIIPAAVEAADLPAPTVIPHIPQVQPVPIEVGSGWYLRGDVGYVFANDPASVYDLRSNGVGVDVHFQNENLTNMLMVGAGVGYQLNDYLRADATIDYKFSGEYYANTGASGCSASTTACTSTEQVDLAIWSLMANAYVDLGSYYGFTPYIGAGIGAAYVDWDAYTSTPVVSGVSYSAESEWNLSLAAMAGASYDITDQFVLDAGYRYQWIDGGNLVTDNVTGLATHDDLHLHEARVGLRYKLGGGEIFRPQPNPQPYPQPYPMTPMTPATTSPMVTKF